MVTIEEQIDLQIEEKRRREAAAKAAKVVALAKARRRKKLPKKAKVKAKLKAFYEKKRIEKLESGRKVKVLASTGSKLMSLIKKGMASAKKQMQKKPKRRRIRRPRQRPIQMPQRRLIQKITGGPPQRPPSPVRQLQQTRDLKSLLTPEEKIEVKRIVPALRRSAAIQILSRRIKEIQLAKEQNTHQMVVKRDIMTGRERLERVVPKEAWTQ